MIPIPASILAIENESDRDFMENIFFSYQRLIYHEIGSILNDPWSKDDIFQTVIVQLKVKATDFDELSDELSFDFVDKNGNEAKYVEIMDIDVDNLLEQIDNGTLEVSDPCAYWLVEGWLIAYFARVNGTDEDALISWLENDSHTVTRNSFQAFWVVVK